MRKFIELKRGSKDELRLEYDENTLYVKAEDNPTQTEKCETIDELNATIEEILAELKGGGFKETSRGEYDEVLDMEEKRKEYFSVANNELPQLLAAGFVEAMKKYNSDKGDEICCILDTNNKQPQMVFAYGDECENQKDKSVFFKYPCELLKKCEFLVGRIETLNLSQESTHWLTDAIALAEEKGTFKYLSVTIYGNVQYGDHELDVIYES